MVRHLFEGNDLPAAVIRFVFLNHEWNVLEQGPLPLQAAHGTDLLRGTDGKTCPFLVRPAGVPGFFLGGSG